MLTLHYPRRIPMVDVIDLRTRRSRLLGPDTHGAYVQPIDIGYIRSNGHERTIIRCHPVTADAMLHMVKDHFGQKWVPLPDEPTQ